MMIPKPLRRYAEYLRIQLETYCDDYDISMYYMNLTQYVKDGEITGIVIKESTREAKIELLNMYRKEVEKQTRMSIPTFDEFYSQIKRDDKINSIIKNE